MARPLSVAPGRCRDGPMITALPRFSAVDCGRRRAAGRTGPGRVGCGAARPGGWAALGLSEPPSPTPAAAAVAPSQRLTEAVTVTVTPGHESPRGRRRERPPTESDSMPPSLSGRAPTRSSGPAQPEHPGRGLRPRTTDWPRQAGIMA